MQPIRPLREDDFDKLYELYKNVSKQPGGIARSEAEINQDYISGVLEKSIKKGISFVVESSDEKYFLAEIHCLRPEPSQFSHILFDLTVVVRSDSQGKGLGKMIFTHLLHYLEQNRTDVLRLELFTRESNKKAIQFYEKLNFKIEGEFENRVRLRNGTFESDIAMAWFNTNYLQ